MDLDLTPEQYEAILHDEAFLNDTLTSLGATDKIILLNSILDLKKKWVEYIENHEN